MSSLIPEIETRVEGALAAFERKRDDIGDEILKLKAQTIKILEEMFTRLESSLQQHADEVDHSIEKSVDNLKKLIVKSKEIQQFMDNLGPIIAALQTKKEVKKTVY